MLKRRGFKLAICSGGFEPFAKAASSALRIPSFLANELEVDDEGPCQERCVLGGGEKKRLAF